MRAPVLAVGDGALGFWGALREVFPDTREQRCWFHKIANVLAALPKSAHPGAKKALAEIWNAEDKRHALDAVKAFEAAYGAKFPKAVAKITDDLDELLAFYDYPAEHWVHLRTTNPDRIDLRHRAQPQQDHQRPRLPGRRTRHGVQADRGRPVTLARRQRTPPGRARPRRRDLRERQTRRTPRRHDHRGGRLKDLDPQVLTIAHRSKERASNAGFNVTRVQPLRPHYARTLDTWAANLELKRDQAIAVTCQEVYDKYMHYLTGCADLFREGYTDVCQFTCEKG